jgi:hypothetical protein
VLDAHLETRYLNSTSWCTKTDGVKPWTDSWRQIISRSLQVGCALHLVRDHVFLALLKILFLLRPLNVPSLTRALLKIGLCPVLLSKEQGMAFSVK